MKVLISGASGYLGGRIANYLIREGVNVFKGTRTKIKFSNDALASNYVETKWFNFDQLVEVCSGFDVIIHCAGMNAKDCMLNPKKALKFNGNETGKFVNASVKAGVKKFIYLSTVHVYSSELTGNFSELTIPSNLHPYAFSNLIGEEKVLEETSKSKYTRGIILRLSNGVGSPINKHVNCWNLIVNDLCKQAVKTNKIELVSNPEIERDFFPISFLEKTILKFLTEEKLEEKIFNLCSSKSKTLKHIADLVSRRANKTLSLNVDIEHKERSSARSKPHLHISNKALQKYLAIEVDLDKEIDVLLTNCQKWFK